MTETSSAMDVLWFRITRRPDEAVAIAGRLGAGRVLVMIDRGEYWQIAYVIAKGTAEKVRAAGLEAFRRDVSSVAPDIADRVGEIRDWDQVKLLTVECLPADIPEHITVDVSELMLHQGIRVRDIQTGGKWKALSEGRVDDVDLARVQREREFPVKVLQGFQTFVQNRFLKPTLDQTRPPTIPLGARVLARVPFLRDLPARFVGLGIRRPHVQSPERQGRTSG